MIPTDTLDPRDPWMKPRRIEVWRYAQERGITEFNDGIKGIPPKDVMVKRLKALGIPPPSVPPRPIGKDMDARSGDTSPTSHHYTGPQGTERKGIVQVDALDVLERDWQTEQQAPVAAPAPDLDNMPINDLRALCKERGIKLGRRDNMNSMREKLRGQSHPS